MFFVLKSLMKSFAMAYPIKSAIMVGAMILAGLLEGISILAVLPLLAMVSSSPAPGVEPSWPEKMVESLLASVGLTPSLPSFLLVIVLSMVLKAALLLLANKQIGFTVAGVTADLRSRLIQSLLNVRWHFFVSHPSGMFANTLSSEAERAGRTYEQLCMSIALAIQVLVYFLLVLIIDFKVALAAIFFGGLLLLLLSKLIKMARKVGTQQTEQMKSMMARITDGLRGMKPLKAMGEQVHLGNHLDANIQQLKQTEMESVIARQLLKTLAEPIIVIFIAIGIMAAHTLGNIPFSAQLVMAVLFFRMITKLSSLQKVWQNVMLNESAFQSLKATIKKAENQPESTPSKGDIAGKVEQVELHNIDFSYDEKAILKDVNLTFAKGNLTTIIGPSGSGKTTLADIIIGLQKPTSGQVKVNDKNLQDIDLNHWRKRIGYVPQELFLFNDTLRENIVLGDPGLDDVVSQALEQAGAKDFVDKLPDGLDTMVGEGGLRLSGGQRQRISIARALVRRPDLLILDEATTALDPSTEIEICQTIKQLSGERIVIAITHQPAWKEVADKILELQIEE